MDSLKAARPGEASDAPVEAPEGEDACPGSPEAGAAPARRAGKILTGLARTDCANLVKGQCLGLTVWSKPFRAPGPCWIMQGRPCEYFRRIILQVAKQRGIYERALKAYARLDKRLAGVEADLRKCACGAELLPQHRLCQECAKRNRRKTYRASQQRKRRQQVWVSTVGEKRPSQAIAPQEVGKPENPV